MNIDDLQTAILSKDSAGVVAALANWSEDDRAAAIEPYNLLMTALGFDDEAIKPCSFQPDDAVVKEKREQLGIQRMSRQERNIDYDMVFVAWLAQYGIADLTAYGRFPCAPEKRIAIRSDHGRSPAALVSRVVRIVNEQRGTGSEPTVLVVFVPTRFGGSR